MNDETMRILKMVQDGTISPEEANEILSASMDETETRSTGETTRLDPSWDEADESDEEPFRLDMDEGTHVNIAEEIEEAFSELGSMATGTEKGLTFPFVGCELEGAKLAGAQLKGAVITGCDLRNADLRGADLRRARLMGCDLREASLRHANLQRSKFFGADLRAIKLDKAELVRCSFWGCDLRGLNLVGARGERIRAMGTDLRKVDVKEWLRSKGGSSRIEDDDSDPFGL